MTTLIDIIFRERINVSRMIVIFEMRQLTLKIGVSFILKSFINIFPFLYWNKWSSITTLFDIIFHERTNASRKIVFFKMRQLTLKIGVCEYSTKILHYSHVILILWVGWVIWMRGTYCLGCFSCISLIIVKFVVASCFSQLAAS